eukprot:Em0016g1051a
MTQPTGPYTRPSAIYEYDRTYPNVLPETRQPPGMQALNSSVRPSPPPPQDTLPVILETLVGENRRLHWQLRENNTVLDLKIKELQECLEAKERDQSRQLETAQGNGNNPQKTEDKTQQWLQEIERLSKLVQQLEKEKNDVEIRATAELASAKDEISRIKQENEELELHRKSQEGIVIRLNDSVKALEEKLKQEPGRPNTGLLQQKLEALGRQLEVKNSAYDDLKQKYQQLQDRQAELAETQQSKGVVPVPKPRTQRLDLQQRIEQLEREKEELEQRCAEAMRARSAADRILASAHEREETLRQENVALKGHVERLQLEVQAHKAQMDLKVQRSQSEGGQVMPHPDVGAQDQRRSPLRSPDVLKEIHGLRSEKEELEATNLTMKQYLDHLIQELEKLKEENSALRDSTDGLELSNRQREITVQEGLQSQLDLYTVQVVQLDEKVAKQRDENARMLEEIRRLKEQLAGSEADRQALIREREALEAEIKTQKVMVSQLTVAAKQKEETEVVVKEYERECTKLITDLGTSDGRLRAVLEEKQMLQQQVEGCMRELTLRMERIQRLEVTRDELLEQVSHQQLQLKQNRTDIQFEVKQREDLEAIKKVLEHKLAGQKAENIELKSQIGRLQQESVIEQQNADMGYAPLRRPSSELHRQGPERGMGVGPERIVTGMGLDRGMGMGPEPVITGIGPERVIGMGPDRVITGIGHERVTGGGPDRTTGIPDWPYNTPLPPRQSYPQPNTGGIPPSYQRDQQRLVQPQEELLVRPYRPPSPRQYAPEIGEGRYLPQPQSYSQFPAPQYVASCPICGRSGFRSVADLEQHSAHCTDFK